MRPDVITITALLTAETRTVRVPSAPDSAVDPEVWTEHEAVKDVRVWGERVEGARAEARNSSGCGNRGKGTAQPFGEFT